LVDQRGGPVIAYGVIGTFFLLAYASAKIYRWFHRRERLGPQPAEADVDLRRAI
jgi:hypothetical protein